MRHSQNFNKIDSFLKLVLNIIILRNVIARWEEGIINEGAGILHQIYRFGGGNQSKTWYYLGPFQTFKAELSRKLF